VHPAIIEFIKVCGEILKHLGSAVVKLAARLDAEPLKKS
jgi:hypothetical protein